MRYQNPVELHRPIGCMPLSLTALCRPGSDSLICTGAALAWSAGTTDE